jgi:hypothetical protein
MFTTRFNTVDITVFSTPFKHVVAFSIAGQPLLYLNRLNYFACSITCDRMVCPHLCPCPLLSLFLPLPRLVLLHWPTISTAPAVRPVFADPPPVILVAATTAWSTIQLDDSPTMAQVNEHPDSPIHNFTSMPRNPRLRALLLSVPANSFSSDLIAFLIRSIDLTQTCTGFVQRLMLWSCLCKCILLRYGTKSQDLTNREDML